MKGVGVLLGVFVALGCVIFGMMGVTRGTHTTMMDIVDKYESVRSARTALAEQVKLSSDDLMTVTVLPDGNHELTLQLPLGVGVPSWGVPASCFSSPGAPSQVGWSLRYTVDEVMIDGEVNRRLVRQIIDVADVVQEKEVIVQGLRDGGADSPGFEVVKAGGTWVITISTVGPKASSSGKAVEFHVRTRN